MDVHHSRASQKIVTNIVVGKLTKNVLFSDNFVFLYTLYSLVQHCVGGLLPSPSFPMLIEELLFTTCYGHREGRLSRLGGMAHILLSQYGQRPNAYPRPSRRHGGQYRGQGWGNM